MRQRDNSQIPSLSHLSRPIGRREQWDKTAGRNGTGQDKTGRRDNTGYPLPGWRAVTEGNTQRLYFGDEERPRVTLVGGDRHAIIRVDRGDLEALTALCWLLSGALACGGGDPCRKSENIGGLRGVRSGLSIGCPS